MDSDEARGSEGDLDHVVVGFKHAAKDLVRSHKDRLEFVKLSLFREAGGGDLDEVSNIVLQRGAAVFVRLLGHGDSTLNKLSLDRIPESIGYHVRFEGGSRNDDSLFELGRETNAESVRGSTPRGIDPGINSHLNRRDCRQPVESLLYQFGSQNCYDRLVSNLKLPVSLGVVSRGHGLGDIVLCAKLLPVKRGK